MSWLCTARGLECGQRTTGSTAVKTRGSEAALSSFTLLVVVALLIIIGGVELNPGPEKCSICRYSMVRHIGQQNGDLEVKCFPGIRTEEVRRKIERQQAQEVQRSAVSADVICERAYCTGAVRSGHTSAARK
ncbi:hypothetical protein C0J52_27916 [Blattella germanica]|nr:hypothetical protein C0J52_27916 [Blattella germanica]